MIALQGRHGDQPVGNAHDLADCATAQQRFHNDRNFRAVPPQIQAGKVLRCSLQRMDKQPVPELELESYGLGPQDLDSEFSMGSFGNRHERRKLRGGKTVTLSGGVTLEGLADAINSTDDTSAPAYGRTYRRIRLIAGPPPRAPPRHRRERRRR